MLGLLLCRMNSFSTDADGGYEDSDDNTESKNDYLSKKRRDVSLSLIENKPETSLTLDLF